MSQPGGPGGGRTRRRRGALAIALLLATVVPAIAGPASAAGVWTDRPDLGPIPLTRAFVAQQFEDFQGRQPTADESQLLEQVIRGGLASGEEVIVGVARLEGADAVKASVTRTYRAYFLRLPDLGGFRYWTGQRAGGLGVLSMSRLFAGSKEFVARYGALDDAAFVTLVYENVLGRLPDPAGLAHWTGQLASGRSRAWVMVQFSESPENRTKTAPLCDLVLLYEGMLRWMPTQPEVDDALAATPFDPVVLAGSLLRGDAYRTLHPEPMATTFQVNAAHDGTEAHPGLPAQVQKRWTHTFEDVVGYPLIARGRVFVTVRVPGPSGGDGTNLYALDVDDGRTLWGPVRIGTSNAAGIAYGDGRVYTSDLWGLARALDERTGAEVWAWDPSTGYDFTSPPVFYDGQLYLMGASQIFSVDPADGAVGWHVPHMSSTGSPAVDATSVTVESGCGVTRRFARDTGDQLWVRTTDCTGGGGSTVVLHGGRAYARASLPLYAAILDGASGSVEGPLAASSTPSFAASVRLEVQLGTLRGLDDATGTVLWSRVGDGKLVTAPVVGGGRVYIGSGSGRIYSWDAVTGRDERWVDAGKPSGGGSESSWSAPWPGMGIGDHLLVVPAGKTLVAFG